MSLRLQENNLDGRTDLQRRMESAIKGKYMGNGREQVLTSVRKNVCGNSNTGEQNTHHGV